MYIATCLLLYFTLAESGRFALDTLLVSRAIIGSEKNKCAYLCRSCALEQAGMVSSNIFHQV